LLDFSPILDLVARISQINAFGALTREPKTGRYQPPVWFQGVLRPDGTPYRQAEVDVIKQFAGKQ
jgi:hypothetical protein